MPVADNAELFITIRQMQRIGGWSDAGSAYAHDFYDLDSYLQADALRLGYTPSSWPNWPVRFECDGSKRVEVWCQSFVVSVCCKSTELKNGCALFVHTGRRASYALKAHHLGNPCRRRRPVTQDGRRRPQPWDCRQRTGHHQRSIDRDGNLGAPNMSPSGLATRPKVIEHVCTSMYVCSHLCLTFGQLLTHTRISCAAAVVSVGDQMRIVRANGEGNASRTADKIAPLN